MICPSASLAFKVIFAFVLLFAFTSPALAHDGPPPTPDTLWSDWHWRPVILLSLVMSAGLCMRGQRAFARRVAASRSAVRLKRTLAWRGLAFYSGLAILAIALCSPLDALSSALFSAHMGQHMLIILVAAPLLTLGDPLTCWLFALPPGRRRRLGQLWNSLPRLRQLWHQLTHPAFVWALQAIAMWAWHAPTAYTAAVKSEMVHSLEHGSFLLTAILFWWVIVSAIQKSSLRKRKLDQGLAILYLFTTMLQTGLLGVLVTFSRIPWYDVYSQTTYTWSLTPLEDQQLAGVVMWIPAGVVYAAAAIILFMTWLGEIEGRANTTPELSDIQSAPTCAFTTSVPLATRQPARTSPPAANS